MKSIGNIACRLLTAVMAAAALTLGSCGRSADYKVGVTVSGLGTQILSVAITGPEGVDYRKIAVMDSHFTLEGRTTAPAVVEIYSNTQTLLGRFILDGGDDGDVTVNPSRPDGIKGGNETNALLSDFLKANGSSAVALNAAIERQTSAEPESLLTVVLLEYYYDLTLPDHSEAYKLMRKVTGPYAYIVADRSEMLSVYDHLPSEVPPLTLNVPNDTVGTFAPARKGLTLYYLYNSAPSHRDSLQEQFEEKPLSGVTFAAIRMNPDTIRWKYLRTEVFPEHTVHLWAPGGVHDPGISALGIQNIPLYIITDSTGHQLARAYTLDEAKAALSKI